MFSCLTWQAGETTNACAGASGNYTHFFLCSGLLVFLGHMDGILHFVVYTFRGWSLVIHFECRTAEQGTAEFRRYYSDIRYFLFDILRFKKIKSVNYFYAYMKDAIWTKYNWLG